MSPVRITALLGLALMFAALAAAAPHDRAFAWLTGQCFYSPAPFICHRSESRFYGRQYDI